MTFNTTSLRLVPQTEYPVKKVGQGTEYGIHDQMRNGLRTVKTELIGKHPLEDRLQHVMIAYISGIKLVKIFIIQCCVIVLVFICRFV
jgi:hypothetical protein